MKMAKSALNQSTTSKIKRTFIETIGLQTARGRLLFFAITSCGILIAPYSWLSHLSLWQYVGVNSPSIGLTRAYWRLLHGDVVGAYERNPLIFVVLAIGLPLLTLDLIKLLKTRKQL